MENLTNSKLQEASTRKRPFEDLNREELITKCKGLLVLAQKAKQSKSELQSEVDNYKKLLNTCELEKKAKDDNIQILQELVDSLTEQKLTFITEIDTAQSKLRVFNNKCTNYEEEMSRQKSELLTKDKNLTTISQKLSDLDSEIISLKRQNNRLLDENEQLINQLTELESRAEECNKIGMHQREQLKTLEKKVLTDEEYQEKIKELNRRIKEIESSHNEDFNQMHNVNEKLRDITVLYENEKSKNDKANNKLRIYKDKILKCANCINQLKNSRFILNKTVKEYSENIPKWQNEIIKASTVLDEQIRDLNEENLLLKNQIKELETQINDKYADTTEVVNLKEQLLHSENGNALLITENATLKSQIIKNNEELNKNSLTNMELKTTVDNLMVINKQLSDSVNTKQKIEEVEEKLKFQIKSLETEKAIIVKEKLFAKDTIVDLENQVKLLNEHIDKLKLDNKESHIQIESLLQNNKILEEKNKTDKDDVSDRLQCEVLSLNEQHEKLKKEYNNLQDLNGLLQEEVETLKLSLEQPNDGADNLSDINVSLQADIVKLETKLAAYKQENGLLLTEVKESRSKLKEFDKLVVENEESRSKLVNYKTENTELLNEMKEINQVLKERGETISKLQKAISEMERLIETLEKDRDSLKDEKNNLIKNIETLKNDLRKAEKSNNENNDISEKVIMERDDALQILKQHEATIAGLQEEIDKLKQQNPMGAELPNEDMSTSTISRAEEQARMKDLDETFEEKYSKLRIFALKLKKKLNETTSQLHTSEQEKSKLKKLLSGDTEEKIRTTNTTVEQDVVDSSKTAHTLKIGMEFDGTELNAKINSLNTSLDKLEKLNNKLEADLQKHVELLSKEKDLHKLTKEQLDKALRDVKKKNVLSLEMEDYERSMKELTSKMEESRKKIIQMESTIDTQEGTITATKTQIKLLEEQIKTEESLNRRTKEELHNTIEESKEKDNVINVKNNIISKLTQELEDEKRNKEESDLEITAILSEKEKALTNHAEEKLELSNKIKRLEFKSAELNEKLNISNIELADLKTEYTSYKVRAQAVLRQNQTIDHSQEEQLKEEAAALRTQIESLTQKLSAAQDQCAEAVAEAEVSRKRAAEAGAEATRAHSRTARLHGDLTRLSQQLDTDRAQHKLQVSTLTQCYKSQINELEAKLQKDMESFKKELAHYKDNVNTKPAEVRERELRVLAAPADDGSDGDSDVNVSLIPREEGEGSEAAPSPPLSKSFLTGGSRRSPVPLERLLEEGVSEDDALDRSSLSLTSDQEIAELKRKVQAQQQKVKHVTVLLAESERECARMAQLSELLKGELRRVRGATQAEHNTEYMKNVTLKFLTLPPGDERSRLIPVLQKILTLSNEETHKIQAIAKGQDPNSSKGWGSYLAWPGGK